MLWILKIICLGLRKSSIRASPVLNKGMINKHCVLKTFELHPSVSLRVPARDYGGGRAGKLSSVLGIVPPSYSWFCLLDSAVQICTSGGLARFGGPLKRHLSQAQDYLMTKPRH